ncbi:Homeodomain-like protein [Niveomyces insectorum RCEF 264]|uniref:Homeodomain-like protein n=1 Tax=Niveomyces insectorum RCEF 264 TaxID=1081102 RepID=A0A167M488_9HYPO|nr:Homeodomain-like protein [Niveomyces insectorum RCEF 264]
MAQRTNLSDIGDSPFCWTTLKWMQSNAGPRTRNAILSFFLHPLVRSYRVRSILGRRSHDRIFDELETFRLTRLQKSPARSLLIPRRAKQHFKGIALCQQKMSASAGGNMPLVETQKEGHNVHKTTPLAWYHKKLADNSLGPAHLAVLTTFPLPEIENDDFYLHLDFLIALAESIDAVFLGTLDPDMHSAADRFASWYGKTHRPKDMPAPAFRGLNRALPLKQGCKPLGAHAISQLCTRREMNIFIQISHDEEKAIYAHQPSQTIRWELLLHHLRERGVKKDIAQIRSIYNHLSRRPASGFISYKLSKWRFNWGKVHLLKEFLDSNGVVKEPKDENDLYFHIPSLEDGCQSSWDIQEMLRRSGFIQRGGPEFMPSFLTRYLPSLLHRDVWAGITANPPERLHVIGGKLSTFLLKRITRVCMHHARRILFRQGVCALYPVSKNEASPRIRSRVFLELWYCVQAQLLADGVPRERLNDLGPLQLAMEYHRRSSTFWDSCHLEDLPPWQYDPVRDGYAVMCDDHPETESSELSRHIRVCDRDNGQSAGGLRIMSAEPEGQFKWPSDDARYKALSSTYPEGLGRQIKATYAPGEDMEVVLARVGPSQLAQHQPSTLRVLLSIMRNHHRITFDNGPDDADDGQFWSTLFIGALDDKWQVQDERVLCYRFGWLLEYIRTGALPAQAIFAQNVLREVLEGTVLTCQTHPYNYEVDVPTSRYLNPDLSQTWTKQFLTDHSDRVKLDASLKGCPGGLSYPAFCDRYGILIPQLWEEAALRFVLPTDSAPPVGLPTGCDGPVAQVHPPAFVAAPHATQETDEDLIPDNTAGHARDSSELALLHGDVSRFASTEPPGSEPALQSATARPSFQRKTRKGYSTHPRIWTAERRGFLEILVSTADDWADGFEKFKAKFGTEHSAKAPAYQARRQGLDIYRISRSLAWTSEQDEYLTLQLQNMPNKRIDAITECVDQLNERFDTRRTFIAVHTRASDLGLLARQNPWTAKELEFLEELRTSGLRRKAVCDKFWDRFGTARSQGKLDSKWYQLVKNGEQKSTLSQSLPKDGNATQGFTWTPEEDKFIRAWEGAKVEALADAFGAEFPGRRSRLAVQRRWETRHQRDAETTARVVSLWTPAEDEFIRNWPGTVFSVFADAFHEKFPGQRTTEALRSRRGVLRKHHSASTVKRCDTNWTADEDAMIKAWPESEESAFFNAFNARFPQRRTPNALKIRWKSVRGLQKKGDSERWQHHWSVEEDEFILKWPDENLRACEVAFQQKFPCQRSKIAVRRRWDSLRAKKMEKGDTARKAGSQWPPEEDELIRNWPDNQRSKCVAAFQKQFPNLRTNSAVKNRWFTLRNEKKPQGDGCDDGE